MEPTHCFDHDGTPLFELAEGDGSQSMIVRLLEDPAVTASFDLTDKPSTIIITDDRNRPLGQVQLGSHFVVDATEETIGLIQYSGNTQVCAIIPRDGSYFHGETRLITQHLQDRETHKAMYIGFVAAALLLQHNTNQ